MDSRQGPVVFAKSGLELVSKYSLKMTLQQTKLGKMCLLFKISSIYGFLSAMGEANVFRFTATARLSWKTAVRVVHLRSFPYEPGSV